MSDVEDQGGQAESQVYRCPECMAEMHYDATTQKLICDHCGAQKEIAHDEGEETIVEHDIASGLAASKERGLGTEVRTVHCQECGATVSFPPTVIATECAFCGSSQVLEQSANRNLIRPESVVPFRVDQNAASSAFSQWLKGLWFRPSDLKKRAKVTEIGGVYVPYWTFDAHVDSSWTADAGYYYYEEEEYEDDEGEWHTRKVQKTRWKPAWGSRSDDFDDVLVCASKGLPEKLADNLSTFDTEKLKPYSAAFLTGWKAEEYAVELNEGWKRGVKKMKHKQIDRCGRDVPGDTHRSLNVRNAFSKETFKHILLPIWISAYRYKDKVFRFLVNGQTGEVVGKAPWSAAKIILFIMSLAAIITGIVFAVRYFR
ncbi:MAG: zinc ribbon domain-containing protein [Deltaproteobacteria bacterium]|nr:zinc ribbon domain-containing protein [Deltaproteobacteria bacterium]